MSKRFDVMNGDLLGLLAVYLGKVFIKYGPEGGWVNMADELFEGVSFLERQSR